MPRSLLALLVAMLLAGCGIDADGSAEAESDVPETSNEQAATDSATDGAATTLAVGVQFEPRSGWALDSDDAFVLKVLGVTEGLVRLDVDGTPQPQLAESWERLDDTQWRFALREDVRFHDGTGLDAAGVVEALNWLFGSDTPPRGLGDGAAEAHVDGDLHVVVTTAEPDPILPLRLATPAAAILAPAAYASDPPDPFGFGTGPFEIVDETPGESATLRPHTDHHVAAPQVSEVTARFIPDAQTRATAVRTGELDVAVGVPTSALPVLSEESDLIVLSAASPRTTSLYPNASRAPFDDPDARAALAAAIDQASLADGLLEGTVPPAGGLFSPSDPWAVAPDPAAGDPELASSLLDAAGLDEDERQVEIWTYPARTELPDLATALQAMLEAGGFEVEVVISEYGVLEPDVLAGDFDLFILSRGYLVDVGDPTGFLESDFGCDGSYNLAHTCDSEVEELLEELGGVDEPAERNVLIGDIERRLLDIDAVVPLVHGEELVVVRDGVEGIAVHPLGHELLTPDLAVADR